MNIEDGRREYAKLSEYSELRTNELSPLLRPFIDITYRYGELICEVTLGLGQTSPSSMRDTAIRDLMADLFDFLTEARPLIIKGKLEIAYPLARRAYESLSLMVACHCDVEVADRWIAGRQIGNGEVRRILGKHPMGEKKESMQALYDFFSKTTHPNRSHLAQRFLGSGNEFVLGAVGIPNLALLADYALKTLNLWFWFGAFISFVYADVLTNADPDFLKTYNEVSDGAKPVAAWLVEQFNRVLAQEQAILATGPRAH